MKHHYWEAPIVIYLFLGGLGGGIMCLTAIMSLIVNPGTGSLFFVPMFFALAALASSSYSSSVSRLCSGECGQRRRQSSNGAQRSWSLPCSATSSGCSAIWTCCRLIGAS